MGRETPTIFLAMFWGGGGPYTIAQIIHAYDWINRGIPAREDIEEAMNAMLSLGIVVRKAGGFAIAGKAGDDFDRFRKRKRKNKFKAAHMYFAQLRKPSEPEKAFILSEHDYAEELAKYRRCMSS